MKECHGNGRWLDAAIGVSEVFDQQTRDIQEAVCKIERYPKF